MVNQDRSATGLDTSSGTRRPRRPAGRLARLGATVVTQILPAHGASARHTAVVDVRGIAVIPIDAGDDRGAVDKDIAERAVPRVLRAAVAARPVYLADRRRPEVLDRDGPGPIVLEHLVLGVARPAAVDVGYPRRGGALEGRGVFADVGPPADGYQCQRGGQDNVGWGFVLLLTRCSGCKYPNSGHLRHCSALMTPNSSVHIST